MYRNIILEFLTSKHLQLAEQQYYQMTLCQIGCKYPNEPIKLIKAEDEINVYHIKEPRIYHKNYDFSFLDNSIISMMLEINEEIKFNKNELTFELTDPYYLKDLKTQDFKSLQATPIIENDQLIGVLITYYNSDSGYIKYSNNELVKLLNALTIDRSVDLNNEIDQLFVKNRDYYKVVMKGNYFYLNDNAKKKIKADDNYLNIKEMKHPDRLISFIRQHGMKKLSYNDTTVYHMEITKTSNKNKVDDINAMYSINKHNLGSNFSFIFVRISPNSSFDESIQLLSNWVNKIDEITYKIYQYNDESLILMTNNKILKKDFEFLKETLNNDYLILLRSHNELSENMNLKKLGEYLYNIQPEKFIYQDYIEWITKYNEDGLSYSDKFKDFSSYYEIMNVNNDVSLGSANYLPLRANLRNSHFLSYGLIVEKELIRLSKENNKNYFINVPYSLLLKRKTYEDIKKMLNNDCNIWLNIMYDGNNDYDEFIKTISKYKKFNLRTSCDSSVYLNYYLMSSLDLFDAIYIQNEEYVHIRSKQVGLPQSIFQYAIKDYKYLIIENFSPDLDLDYNHPNCYYVIKRKIEK